MSVTPGAAGSGGTCVAARAKQSMDANAAIHSMVVKAPVSSTCYTRDNAISAVPLDEFQYHPAICEFTMSCPSSTARYKHDCNAHHAAS